MLDRRPVQSEFRAEGEREQGVGHLMPAQELGVVIAIQTGLAALHGKRRAAVVHPDISRHPIIGFAESDTHHPRPAPPDNGFGPGIVAVDEKRSFGWEGFGHGPFLPGHAGEVSKKLQVLAGNIGDHAKMRGHHAEQRRQFTGMIGACFEHGGLMGMFQLEQGQWHADFIVKTGFAPEDCPLLPQDRSDQLLGGGLAVGAAHGRHGQGEIAAVTRAQPPQGRARAVHGNDGASLKIGRQFCALGHDRRRAPPRRFGQEVVGVEPFASQGEKQIARLGLARINAEARDRGFRRTVAQLAGGGFGDVF